MTAICGKNDGSWVDGTGFRFEFPIEKLIEASERGTRIRKIFHIEAVAFDKRLDPCRRFRLGHAFAIPFREAVSLDEGVKRQLPQRVAVSPSEERFAINLLGFLGSRMPVEISDAFHSLRKPLRLAKVKGRWYSEIPAHR